ncbi:MAG: 2-oxoacid ferredoxin oxidoreductase, partial [Chloroflexi bacterium]|nr:2-oxoacid ferredoxin oxidoreductase [Chloroflexota bacterium]
TTGQVSPTSREGMKTKSTPFGNIETPLNPLTSAIMNGATYVARGYSGDVRQLAELVKGGIAHRGFSLIDIFSPCTTFNKDNDHPFFKQRVKKLEDDGHDSSDWKAACERAMEWGDTIYTGLFYQKTGQPTLDDREPILKKGGPIATRETGLSEDQVKKIVDRMM